MHESELVGGVLFDADDPVEVCGVPLSGRANVKRKEDHRDRVMQDHPPIALLLFVPFTLLPGPVNEFETPASIN